MAKLISRLTLSIGVLTIIFASLSLINNDESNKVLYQASASESISIDDKKSYYLRADAPEPPEISANSYIVADLLTGDVLIQKSSEEIHPIASVSKLVTALVALELKLTESDLLYPLLLESSNKTAEDIAGLLDRKSFIKSMNNYVARLGMLQTHFVDPSGLSVKNVSSANDLLTLIRYIYKQQPDLLALTLVPQKQISKKEWQNNNLFVQERHRDYLGGKSGYTPEAGSTLVSVFALPLVGQELRPVVIILLGTDSERGVKYEVAQNIIDYVVANVYYK